MSTGPKNTNKKSDDERDQREDSRRSLYVGEKIHCLIQDGEHRHKIEIMDISPRGLAFVWSAKKPGMTLEIDQQITLEFRKNNRQFEVVGTIANCSQMVVLGQRRDRFGIKFVQKTCPTYTSFDAAIDKKMFVCKSYVRPQVTCWDPFFFREAVFFQVNGFTREGIDIVVSSRWKSIIPGQPIELEIYIPCHGLFKIECINSNLIYQSAKMNRFRLYMKFVNPSRKFLEAVSEYLILICPGTTPFLLRDAGFPVGQLHVACEIKQQKSDDVKIDPLDFKSSIVALPPFGDLSNRDPYVSQSRNMICKLGPITAAHFRLVFFGRDDGSSELQTYGHKLPQSIKTSARVELARMHVSSEVSVSDFFMPMLLQIIRIVAQSQSKFLMLECEAPLRKILHAIGFLSYGSKVRRVNEDMNEIEMHLLVLDVNAALSNQGHYLDAKIWESVYRDLTVFLNRSFQEPKSVSKFRFPG